VEAGGAQVQLAQTVDGAGLLPVGAAVVALELAADLGGRLVDLVGDRRRPVEVAGIREDGVTAVVTIPLRVQGGGARAPGRR
jgi:hypothetical protein